MGRDHNTTASATPPGTMGYTPPGKILPAIMVERGTPGSEKHDTRVKTSLSSLNKPSDTKAASRTSMLSKSYELLAQRQAPKSSSNERLTPDLAGIMGRLTDQEEFLWSSPLLTHELFIAQVFHNGDVGAAKNALYLDRSGELLDGSVNHLAVSMHQLSVAPSLRSVDRLNAGDGGKLSAHSLNAITSRVSQSELRPLAASRAASTDVGKSHPSVMPAPKMPKRQLQTAKPTQPPEEKKLQKFNSCSTVFAIDGTLFHASESSSERHLEFVLRAVAHAVSTHMHRTYTVGEEVSKHERQNRNRAHESWMAKAFKSSDTLSEKLRPIWRTRILPDDVLQHPEAMRPPRAEDLYNFMRSIFDAAMLTAEVAVVALIYLERLLARTGIALHGVNCFRTLLGAIMLASKIWDDQAVWNTDFRITLPDLKLSDLNFLERWWLQKIQWDVGVKRALFAQYWFELRVVAERLWQVRLGQDNVLPEGERATSTWMLNDKRPNAKPLGQDLLDRLGTGKKSASNHVDYGAQKLKRSRSDNIFTPVVPAASVI